MKYYIIKAKSVSIQEDLVHGICQLDKDAEIVNKIEESDVVVLQQGWTRSKNAVKEKSRAYSTLGKPCREGYLYTDKYKVHLN